MNEEATTIDVAAVQMVDDFDYDEELKLLAIFRQQEENAMQEFKALRQKFEASPKYQEILTRLRNSQGFVEKMTKVIKSHAEGDYGETKNKHPHPDVDIRTESTLIYETSKAVEYCRDHLINALKLDYQFFEKHARAVATTAPLDFVKIEMQPKATISTDLSAYLDNEPAVVDIDFEKIEPVPY